MSVHVFVHVCAQMYSKKQRLLFVTYTCTLQKFAGKHTEESLLTNLIHIFNHYVQKQTKQGAAEEEAMLYSFFNEFLTTLALITGQVRLRAQRERFCVLCECVCCAVLSVFVCLVKCFFHLLRNFALCTHVCKYMRVPVYMRFLHLVYNKLLKHFQFSFFIVVASIYNIFFVCLASHGKIPLMATCILANINLFFFFIKYSRCADGVV